MRGHIKRALEAAISFLIWPRPKSPPSQVVAPSREVAPSEKVLHMELPPAVQARIDAMVEERRREFAARGCK